MKKEKANNPVPSSDETVASTTPVLPTPPSSDETAASMTAEPGDLLGQLSDLQEENRQLLAVNEKLTAKIEELTPKEPTPAKSTAAPKHEVSSETFEVEGATYRFRIPAVIFEGHKVTAAEVLANENLQRRMIERKCGMIAPVEKVVG